MAREASSAAGRERPPRAVLLDALGTLVDLDAPVPNLVDALARRGIDVGPGAVGAALGEEIAYYRAHHDEAFDEPALDDLRDRCAEVFRRALPTPAAGGDPALVREALLDGLRFRAFEEVPAVLAALRAAGSRIVIVSNWDVSLHGVLRTTGLERLVDAVLTSAQERVAKPDPEIFRRALQRAGGVEPARALHVGDDLDADIAGARAAGIPAVLVDRAGTSAAPGGVRVVRTLAELFPPAR